MNELGTEIVEHLVAMREQLDSMNKNALDLVHRMDGVSNQLVYITACTDRIDSRLDRIESRLDQIETKLH